MAARGPQNGQQVLERCLSLGFFWNAACKFSTENYVITHYFCFIIVVLHELVVFIVEVVVVVVVLVVVVVFTVGLVVVSLVVVVIVVIVAVVDPRNLLLKIG